MTTLRERFIEQLMAALSADENLLDKGVVLERSLFAAFASNEPRVLVVHRGSDPVVEENIGVTTRECGVAVSAVVHADAPDREADVMFEAVHPIVMAFQADGLIGVREAGTDEPQAGDADGGVGVVTMRYLFLYQTRAGHLD
ncbi:hypothetical protein Y037_3068 [Burkholderia pseudomallei MSHR983]|uniref:hypothetical protein n=1 Tax=Burkholderia pseudomallei TaxID=28450 RepID=UPI0005377B1A|nr:hypothetical protein [Burkholderia pseudomallei]KGU62883.1 hypothetical protein Y037_3068 [Burkholderia pseudomallei MSHR983]KGW78994.1 hypothetical protein Y046_4956 [Burkholderia pseudomallei MSHR2990]